MELNFWRGLLRKRLHEAARIGRTETVAALLAADADRYAKDIKGRTPLQWATENAHTRAAILLE